MGMVDDGGRAQFFLTAATAYPALERAFIEARSDISAGFRVFDPTTKLRSKEALAIGDTWGDLVAHTLARGVRFRLVLTDFDPVVRPSAHRMTWAAVKGWKAAAEASGRPDLFELHPAMHPARLGFGTSIILWPKVMYEIRSEVIRLNGLSKAEAETDLELMPQLAPHITGTHPNLRPNYFTFPRLVPTTHHQKLAVFDGETVYIGGLDLDERRYDTAEHNRDGEETWRDSQMIIRSPLAADAKRHLDEVLDVTAGKAEPSKLPHLLRTLSKPQSGKAFTFSPTPVLSEIEAAHLDGIKNARDLIYMETQFFRSVPVAKAMAEAAGKNPHLKVLLILPAAPEDVAFEDNSKSDARYGEYLQAKCLDLIQNAFGDRLFVAAPAQPRPTSHSGRGALKSAELIYLHAKISIFDEAVALISSANLNGRSMRWDTEAGAALTHHADIVALRNLCLDHWFAGSARPMPEDILDHTRQLALSNEALKPQDRQGFLLPMPLKPARRFGRNLPGVPEEVA